MVFLILKFIERNFVGEDDFEIMLCEGKGKGKEFRINIYIFR